MSTPRSTDESSAGSDTKSARTRQRILDATAEVLSVKGYSSTKLSDIAAVANVQAPALYYYFSSRDELIEEVVSTGTRLTLEHAREALAALPDSADGLTRISSVMKAHLEIALGKSDYATAGIRNSGQLPIEMRARQKKQEREYGRLWVHLFRTAQADGHITADLDPELTAMMIIGSMNWAPEWWNPRRGSLDALCRTTISLFIRGISPEREGGRS